MENYQSHIQQVIQSSLEKAPEEMLEDCLRILIRISGASGGSILGEEGPHLQFLFANLAALIGTPQEIDCQAQWKIRQFTSKIPVCCRRE